jgi:hypothetical protein
MSAGELLEMTSSPWMAITDPGGVRNRIHEEFDAAKSSEERGALLALFKANFDITESHLAKNAPEKLAEFQKARAKDYNLFLDPGMYGRSLYGNREISSSITRATG